MTEKTYELRYGPESDQFLIKLTVIGELASMAVAEAKVMDPASGHRKYLDLYIRGTHWPEGTRVDVPAGASADDVKHLVFEQEAKVQGF